MKREPLSTRMRPRSLDEFVGQQSFLGETSLLRNAIEKGTFESAVFFGPSGTGKTTLARIIASEVNANFHEINASVTGTKELKELIERAKDSLFSLEKRQTYVYIDEFHRWNKLQQDSLLQALEEGVLRCIGSTTENPYFSINNAVLSRIGSIYEFEPLCDEEVLLILQRALADEERGLGESGIEYDAEAISALAAMSSGDARVALDRLGFIADNLAKGERITLGVVAEAMQRKTLFYDKEEDRYNLLSALQKSIRGSDPDAAVHYLARLLEGSGDITMVGRRLVVMASEDIGMAYPQAIAITVACVQAAHMTGMPEARIPLSHAAVFLAACPKSNSANTAYSRAVADLNTLRTGDVPKHLKDTHYRGAEERGHVGYVYPHDFGGWVEQQYLPDELYERGTKYYEPTENGREVAFKKYLEGLGKKRKDEDNPG